MIFFKQFFVVIQLLCIFNGNDDVVGPSYYDINMILAMQGIIVFPTKFVCGQQGKVMIVQRKSVGILILLLQNKGNMIELKLVL